MVNSSEMINHNDIAIVGMAVRVPGAATVNEFWKNLTEGVESIRALSPEELEAAGESADRLRSKNYVPSAAPLDKMEYFDADFFGFSPKEAAILDPQHRHFLECAWEALEDAGYPPERVPGPIGVFAGCGMGSYFYFNLCSNPDLVDSVGMFLLRHTGNDKDFLSTRASFLFDLKGPSINVQTACSTSLVAVHLACQSLLSGESDMALAGGVTIELPHRRGYLYQENEILSPDGHCHAFDARAEGTVFGSGVGVVVLKRLKDALEAGDNVIAVIRGSAVNNDGSAKAGYLAPSVDGQAAAISEALAIADVPADSIGYVECHGTGTYLGDPIEVSALTLAHRQTTDKKQYCRIGSVKTNIGHLDTAAGVVALIKAARSVQQGFIPPSLNFEKPNPSIDFEHSPFLVNDRLFTWDASKGPRRAGVNSLGVGGTNAHVVLEEPPAFQSEPTSGRQLITLSARSRPALEDMTARLADHLEAHPEQEFADVCFTLLEGRRAFAQRRVLSCGSREEAITFLRSKDPRRIFTHTANAEAPEIVFLFPGGGAQYASMARGLYEEESVFQTWMDRGFLYLDGKVPFDPKAALFPGGDEAVARAEEFLLTPSVQLPLLFMVEFALAQLLISKGVQPTALIGHSMGENTAACLAGVFSFEDALGLVLLRGKLLDTVPEGGMLSVALSESALRARLGDDLDLACVNAPELCVASGPRAALDRLKAELDANEIEAKPIPIHIAAHSRMLDPILEEFRAYLRSIRLSSPQIRFVSNRTGTWITNGQATDPNYWVEHLRNTVHFFQGIDEVIQGTNRVLLEVGPGNVLGSIAKQHPKVNPQNVIGTLRHPKDTTPDGTFLLSVFGRLWGAGRALSAEELWPQQKRRRVSLPTYAFQRERYWIEPGVGSMTSSASIVHPERIADPERWFYRPVWRREDVTELPPDEPLSWLVFVDDAGLGDRVVQSLTALGHSVITVRAGDAFERLSDSEYLLPPEQGKAGYQALFRDLIGRGHTPQRILHSWLWSTDESFRPGSTFFHRNLELGFYSLLFLAQALATEEYPTPLHLIALTTGAQQVAQEHVAYPEQATTLGPCRVIPRELAGITVSSVDLPAPHVDKAHKPGGLSLDELLEISLRQVASAAKKRLRTNGSSDGRVASTHFAEFEDQLLRELFAEPGNRTLAIRKDTRYRLHYERLPLPRSESLVQNNGAVLITGGFGGIGLSIARSLAKDQRAKLLLLARTPLPSRHDWESWEKEHPIDPVSERIRAVRELEGLGAEVMVLAADVADLQAVSDAVTDGRSKFGRIDGVIHAAGTVNDAPLLAKSEVDANATFTAKLHGTRVLWEALKDQPPSYFLLFSSTSTAIAAPGQVDYVAANSFLNSFAAQLRAEGVHATALNWGVWNDVGMAVNAATELGIAVDVAAERPARHPWFRGVSRTGGGATLTLELSTSTHWVLDEHRTISGQAILPGTGYIELIRAALAELSNASPAFQIDDLYFFRPLQVSDGETKLARIQLTPSERGYSVEVHSLAEEKSGNQTWERHSQAQISLIPLSAVDRVDLSALEARCPRVSADRQARTLRSPQEDHLRFGGRWRVLESMRFGEGEACATLGLASDFTADVDQVLLHPGLLDLATGFAMSLIEGYDLAPARQLWVPITYRRMRVHGGLPARIRSWVKNHGPNRESDEFASFDVWITDEEGRVLVEVTEFTIKKLVDPEFGAARPATANDLVREESGQRELSAPELAFQHNLSLGIRPEEGVQALHRVLTLTAPAQLFVSSLDLNNLIRQTDALSVHRSGEIAKFSRPKLDSTYVEPRDDVERTLVDIWEDLLGVENVGVQDSFFDLGGHSLIAVRLFAKLNKQYKVDYPISVLFEAPTIEACAKLIREAVGDSGTTATTTAVSEREPEVRTRYKHLVAMHPSNSEDDRPFFLAAGMFGNVLNLRQLANLIGKDRPFYGLQARGLYGDDKPHATFEEMATDYLEEIRQVQPHGPYLLGGFSGGGIVAYEMAQQLSALGEEVSLLVMLDTPIPSDTPLSTQEKLAIHRQNLSREGLEYPVNWLKQKLEYRKHMADKTHEREAQEQGGAEPGFHSLVIESAFYAALAKYQVKPLPMEIQLFRPKLRPTHQFSDGQLINRDRRRIYSDNGWSRYVPSVRVFEMPGDHDSMVLEPNVRILAAHLRRSIEGSEPQLKQQVAPLGAGAITA